MLLVMLLKGILFKLDISQNVTSVNADVVTSDPRSVPQTCFSRAPVHSTAVPEKVPFLYQSPYNVFHTWFFILIRKIFLYLTQFTYLHCKLFEARPSSSFAHGFLDITLMKVNHSIQKGKILIKRRKALGLDRLIK